jgi:cell division protein FtsX
MEDFITSVQDLFIGLFAGMSGLAIGLIGIFCGLIALLAVYFIRIHIAYRMAVNRHRDPLGWALLSFFVSPLLTWIILLIAGDGR